MAMSDDERSVPPPLRKHGGSLSLTLVSLGVVVCSALSVWTPRWGLLVFGIFALLCGVARWLGARQYGGERPLALVVRRPAVDATVLCGLGVITIVLDLLTQTW